ncbi:histidine phosphatase family protein [Citreicella sp. C3M06]|uniref:histidine phosphatase family protein n=1 Tax=Citreicella sp. C3M06 TaxID=2841564 RepID=UPI001C08C5A7|nr:histidine phosphatase family protein [Citreicella sp. C3M06]MBU2963744.1 histidine phosphatase family protein [Citreicella sp. C3M06]
MTPPDPSEMILIRHAAADHKGRLCGRSDVPAILPLPVIPRPLRDWLAPCALVCSPALRCRQTAQALFPDRLPDCDPALWEQDFGAQEGMAFAELPDLGPMSRSDLARHASPGGESFADLVARVAPALERHAQRPGPLAIVAHAGTVRAALGLALGDPAQGLAFEIAPLSVTRLRRLDAGYAILSVNGLLA